MWLIEELRRKQQSDTAKKALKSIFFFCSSLSDLGDALPFCGVVNFCLKPESIVLGNVDPRSQMSTSLVIRAWKMNKYVSIDYRVRAGDATC